jgi:hypothetical protein
LFLIVDHHPFAGAAKELAKEFGFELFNGHAQDKITAVPHYFHRANKTLNSNVIMNGRDITARIDSTITFGGAAIKIPEDASPILTFDEEWLHFLPDTAWNYKHVEPTSIKGFSQGTFKKFGKGKLVVFGDGNMFQHKLTKMER